MLSLYFSENTCFANGRAQYSRQLAGQGAKFSGVGVYGSFNMVLWLFLRPSILVLRGGLCSLALGATGYTRKGGARASRHLSTAASSSGRPLFPGSEYIIVGMSTPQPKGLAFNVP
ncbi:hypothetical protein KCP69_13075 [Salmonella enterica subsp. enterica]|nr:hypothetical protein KCP69_13075 [Salmonella enterica subsp. enterica]